MQSSSTEGALRGPAGGYRRAWAGPGLSASQAEARKAGPPESLQFRSHRDQTGSRICNIIDITAPSQCSDAASAAKLRTRRHRDAAGGYCTNVLYSTALYCPVQIVLYYTVTEEGDAGQERGSLLLHCHVTTSSPI